MVLVILFLLSLSLVKFALGANCWVPRADVIKFDMVSDTNLEVVDSNYKFLKKAQPCTFSNPSWPSISDTQKVWDQATNTNLGLKRFRLNFEIIGIPIYGYLITGCDNFITTLINGVDINCGIGDYNILVSCDILRFLKSGYNYIIFSCDNPGGDGYLAFKLSIESQF